LDLPGQTGIAASHSNEEFAPPHLFVSGLSIVDFAE
jgi:hypothetical protein